jgi:predicted metal-binding membrane protein
MILLYAHAYRHEQRQQKLPAGAVPTLVFALGYLIAWAAFSVAATFLQWGLERADLLHAFTMWSLSPMLTAALLIAAGLYQLTPLKRACLENCRSPASWLAAYFKPGAAGALELGLRHGIYCVGCCWVLMALLFAGGVMNLVWIAGLAIYVLFEKLAPWGESAARIAAVVLLAAGVGVAARQFI